MTKVFCWCSLKLENFWFYIWAVDLWLNFTIQVTLHHLLPMPMNKILSAKTNKYILKCWERSVKRKSNISFRVMKNSSFDQRFLYIWLLKPLEILWWRFLVPRSEHLLVSSATLSCKTQYFDFVNVSILTIIQIAFF